MVRVCFIGGPYDGTNQPLPPVSEGERLNVSGNQATPPEQDDDRGSKVCEGQWYSYVEGWASGRPGKRPGMKRRSSQTPQRVVRNRDEVAVAPVGGLDLASADRLAEEVRQLRAAGATQIVLDLRQVDVIDSTGLRMLLSLRNDAKRNEHALTLVPPVTAARRIFEITGTRGLFDWRIDRPGG